MTNSCYLPMTFKYKIIMFVSIISLTWDLLLSVSVRKFLSPPFDLCGVFFVFFLESVENNSHDRIDIPVMNWVQIVYQNVNIHFIPFSVHCFHSPAMIPLTKVWYNDSIIIKKNISGKKCIFNKWNNKHFFSYLEIIFPSVISSWRFFCMSFRS